MISKIIKWFKNIRQPAECDHIFYPYYNEKVDPSHPIGQACCLCDKFNSNEELGITFDLEEFKKKHNVSW